MDDVNQQTLEPVSYPEAELSQTDPWADYAVTGVNFREGLSGGYDFAQMTTPEASEKKVHETYVSTSLAGEALANVVEKEKTKEILDASFEVSIDKEAIANILANDPQIAPITLSPERYADLQQTLEAIAGLPEHLHFEPGITLIVGENGLGKSTLNQALMLARRLKSRYNQGYQDDQDLSFEEFRSRHLSIADYNPNSRGGMDVKLSPLAFVIAQHIDIEDGYIDGDGGHSYFDASMLRGIEAETSHGYQPRSDRYGQISMTRGSYFDGREFEYAHSHGQGIHGLFDHLKSINKDTYEREAERRNAGEYSSESYDEKRIMAFDELESGQSPKNQLRLKQRIQDTMMEGSMVIMATNSVSLYFDPSLPRIDLEHPELGIHRPTDHSDIYNLDDFIER